MDTLFGDVSVGTIREFDPFSVTPGTTARFRMHLVSDGIGQPVYLPVIVARGYEGDKVLGCTAVVHGNELNGIPVVLRLFRELNPATLHGIVIGIPIVNIPSVLRRQRRFIDGIDLNHIMPGKPDGNVSEVYVHRFVEYVVRHCNFLLDFHTASSGRINSYYVRADMEEEDTARMARLQNPQIIVHNPPHDGTLRGAAEAMGIASITMEVGDPDRFQRGMIHSSLSGVRNVLIDLGFEAGVIEPPEAEPVICSSSYWLYTDAGGILRVRPDLTERVQKGQVIATLSNIYGDIIKEYIAPEDGIVIGKSVNPICPTGGRILHLGIVNDG